VYPSKAEILQEPQTKGKNRNYRNPQPINSELVKRSREQPIKSPEENWVEQDSHQNPSMHSHSLRGGQNTHPPKNTNLQKKKKKKMGCRRIKTARKQDSSAYHNNKKQLHPRFKTVQILAKSLPKKSLT